MSDIRAHDLQEPRQSVTYTAVGRNLAASAELFERMTRRYGKPAFGIDTCMVEGKTVEIEEEFVWERLSAHAAFQAPFPARKRRASRAC